VIRALAAAWGALAALGAPPAALAGAPDQVDFALVIGVNQSVESGVPPLRYADDDAARYRDLLRVLGARTYLFATLDENTRRLHPEAAAEAQPAQRARLHEAVARIGAEVTQARQGGRPTTLYVVYAGHGHIAGDGKTGFVSLDDGRLTGRQILDEIIDRAGADRTHLIVDACNSYMLALGRGRGGQRWPVSGYARLDGALLERKDVGLLLSTSSERQSHEWSAFQAGVFSHEVRSGMYGPADADGDGVVSYQEIAAFVRRANESIANEKFRPELFWRPPADTTTLVDLLAALGRRVEIPGAHSSHYYLEDPQGVRLADFHNGPSLTVRLLRPPAAPRLYLRRTRDQREYVLRAAAPAVLRTSELVAEEARAGERGAAHEAFGVLFALPFDADAVAGVEAMPAAGLPGDAGGAAEGGAGRRRLAIGLAGLSLVAASAGAGALLSARAQRDEIGPDTPQARAAEQNRGIAARKRVAGAALGVAGAVALGAATVLLWPDSPEPPLVAGPASNGLMLGWQGRF
jgi:hypothetical protein